MINSAQGLSVWPPAGVTRRDRRTHWRLARSPSLPPTFFAIRATLAPGLPAVPDAGSRAPRPVADTLHDPMLSNGHALIFSSSLTQVIGVFYGIVAARAYPADVVGRNSAALTFCPRRGGGA